jgi:hypothetical protein
MNSMDTKDTPKIDLIIVDIDGTLLYHQTVASANRLFLIYLCRLFGMELREKKMMKTADVFKLSLQLLFTRGFRLFSKNSRWRHFKQVKGLFLLGTRLYISNIFRRVINLF